MSKLYLIPTPIGNLEDITLRALRLLKEVDIILAEDTRQTKKLLQHFEITKTVISHHMHNEHQTIERIVQQIAGGTKVALVSDAGTPGISDPGFLLTRACIEKGIEIVTLPGATAFVPALVSSGLPSDRFVFEGFLPQKKGRQTRINALIEENRTMIFYESPHRLVKALEQFAQAFGPDRKASVSREISKMFEEHKRGTLAELILHFTTTLPKGEIVICVKGKE
ncbi:MAG: 16S rRNA (cytidine(1402)-2'-O)-methyltransferase [Bacteroidota bacterium]